MPARPQMTPMTTPASAWSPAAATGDSAPAAKTTTMRVLVQLQAAEAELAGAEGEAMSPAAPGRAVCALIPQQAALVNLARESTITPR
mmetsp:Transcript_112801/g.195689  ORF Transcript_112801/g.195689 Transcript_112801/m.195689 type:complete len:88 (+) Transcript_112801:510-773(+)